MVKIESLDQDGRGVARIDGKVTFVDGALPGEQVRVDIVRRKRNFDLANVAEVVRASSQRVTPRCPHFERCGGCKLQHLDTRAQVAMKQRVLEEDLRRLGEVRPAQMLPPIYGPDWGYRHRARFAVKYVARKNGALVGFHERRTHYVVDMDSCAVLPEPVSALIAPLRELISSLTLAARIPQIEVALGTDRIVLAIRVLDRPTLEDLVLLRRFAATHAVSIRLQGDRPDALEPLDAADAPLLAYTLPEFGLRLDFAPSDFTQVNPYVNRALVHRAVALLDVRSGDRIADLFCGLGNFSLALARRGAQVTGVEGVTELVERARANAASNGLSQRAEFVKADLFRDAEPLLRGLGALDGLLLDPPRDGAFAIVQALTTPYPPRIVYVSCNPSTLARDAGVLVREKGYRMRAAGVVNMFPHTAHVESIALFERA